MGTISKDFEFSAGATIIASEHNQNFDELYNEINGQLSNINIDSNAAIVASKLNLASIVQDITHSGAMTHSGTFNTTGATNLGDGADLLTINCSSGITYTPAATWTFTAGQTVSGTWANLGSVTTCDINGGTIDGVTIGASSAPTVTDLGSVATCDINGGTLDGVQVAGASTHGAVFYNNGSNDVAQLATGTSGQYLQSQGSGAPQWNGVAWQFDSSGTFTTSSEVNATVAVATDEIYNLVVDFQVTSVGAVQLNFDSDETTDYRYVRKGTVTTNFSSTTDYSTTAGAATGLLLGNPDATGTYGQINAYFSLSRANNYTICRWNFDVMDEDTGGYGETGYGSGLYVHKQVTSVDIISSGITGRWRLYKGSIV